MKKITAQLALLLLVPFIVLLNSTAANAALVKGIYVTQTTLEDTKYFTYLIARAKKAGVTTFVIDLELPSKLSQKNLALVKNSGINYVARIIIFSDGASANQLMNKAIWEKKYKLMQTAIAYGATAIQIDYIRYNTKQKASTQNAENVFKVIQWFKDQLAANYKNIPLQVDVFGITSYGPELHIGQDLKLISKTSDALCPMVYPSHFDPYVHHAERPYETVYGSLEKIKGQFNNKVTFKLLPYIELSNYRYPLSQNKKIAYIRAQIKAVEDAGADGWYAWSPHNKYDNLFNVLENTKVK